MNNYEVGQRIRITEDCRDNPVATGKMGFFAGRVDIEFGDGIYPMPLLKLDDGDSLLGCECWWEVVDETAIRPLEEVQAELEEYKAAFLETYIILTDIDEEFEDVGGIYGEYIEGFPELCTEGFAS